MRCGHANCLQDRGERIEAPGELGEAMLHEAVPDDQTQWDRSPTGDRRSADQVDGKVAPSWRSSVGVAHGFHWFSYPINLHRLNEPAGRWSAPAGSFKSSVRLLPAPAPLP